MGAILLLHGFLTDYRDFDLIIPALNKEYEYVSLYTFPGHLSLETGTTDFAKFTVEDTFKTVESEMEALLNKYDFVDILGFSMGGAVATYLASKYNVRKLVLLSPANKYLNFSLPLNRISYFVKTVLERITSTKLTLEEKKELDEKMGAVRVDDVRSINMAFKKLIPNYNFHTLSTFIKIVRECNLNLTSINCPTLVIWGELDQLVPKKSIDGILKIVESDDKNVIIYKDISHLMLASKHANKIVKDILGFLKKA